MFPATKFGRPHKYDFVTGNKIDDTPSRHAAQRCERTGVGIEQHFVALARIGAR